MQMRGGRAERLRIGANVGGEFLVIDPQGIAHLVQKTSDGVGANTDTEVAQRHGNLLRSAPRPLQPGNGIASGVVFQQLSGHLGAAQRRSARTRSWRGSWTSAWRTSASSSAKPSKL